MAKKPAPTKANLFKAQKELRFAVEGAELLHQKRDVLVMELMNVLSDFKETESSLRTNMIEAMNDFLNLRVLMGSEELEQAFIAGQPEIRLKMEKRGLMGISLPKIALSSDGNPELRGLLGTPPIADEVIFKMKKIIPNLLRYVEIVATIWRLSIEIEKTQRRINAIENLFIPATKEIIHWIKSVMEENEREELFRRKLLKNRVA